jgi:hypothetical protein
VKRCASSATVAKAAARSRASAAAAFVTYKSPSSDLLWDSPGRQLRTVDTPIVVAVCIPASQLHLRQASTDSLKFQATAAAYGIIVVLRDDL